MAIKYLSKSKIQNKTVLVRCNLDVPVSENGIVSDDFRLRELLPSLKLLKSGGNKIILCGKRGRPKGKWVKELTLKSPAQRLAELLNMKFMETDHFVNEYGIPHLLFFSGDIREKKSREQLDKIPYKDIVVLENLEFYPEEQGGDKKFAKILASLAEVYVNEDFPKCHHPVVSNLEIVEYLPAYAGLILEKETKMLGRVLKKSERPFVLMTGGVKLTEKVGVLQNLGKKADKILVGGGVASLLFKAKGFEVGLSRIEEGEEKVAKEILLNYKDKLLLPVDVVVANKNLDSHSTRSCLPHQVGSQEMILDVGPKTILAFSKELKSAKTIIWSGPLGFFEHKPFHHGTFALARLIGGRGKGKAFVVVGGGDTVDAIIKSHQFSHIDHISTGGGAMLEFLAGDKLEALEVLK